MPRVIAARDAYRDRGLRVVGIGSGNTGEEFAAYVEEHNLPWPNVYDTDHAIRNATGVRGIPTLVLVDAKGRVVNRFLQHDSLARDLRVFFERRAGSE